MSFSQKWLQRFSWKFVGLLYMGTPTIWHYHRARWLRGNAWDSHSGGPGFESRCRPTWLMFFRGFPQSWWQMLGWIFITTIHQVHIRYHKIKISELNKWNIDSTTIEIHSLLVHTQSLEQGDGHRILFIPFRIKESRVSYTIYTSRTAEPIWLKIGGEVASNKETDMGYFLSRSL